MKFPSNKQQNKKLKTLIKELDKEFSIFIRRRDTDENGYGKCITCQKMVNISEADNGHFVGRQFYSVRWNEKNCHLQCKRCNGFGAGEQAIYGKVIDDRYGVGTSDVLLMQKRVTKKLDRFELAVLIEYYKEQNKLNQKQ